MRLRTFPLSLILILALFAGCSNKYIWTQTERSAPRLSMESLDGKTYSLPADGSLTIIHFWSITEPLSRHSLEPFTEVYDHFNQSSNVQVFTVNTGLSVTKEQLQTYLKKNSLTFPVVFDHNKKIQQALSISAFPQTVFISKQGVAKWIMYGYRDDIDYPDTIIDKAEEMLKGN